VRLVECSLQSTDFASCFCKTSCLIDCYFLPCLAFKHKYFSNTHWCISQYTMLFWKYLCAIETQWFLLTHVLLVCTKKTLLLSVALWFKRGEKNLEKTKFKTKKKKQKKKTLLLFFSFFLFFSSSRLFAYRLKQSFFLF
jgi:hypothetical protein